VRYIGSVDLLALNISAGITLPAITQLAAGIGIEASILGQLMLKLQSGLTLGLVMPSVSFAASLVAAVVGAAQALLTLPAVSFSLQAEIGIELIAAIGWQATLQLAVDAVLAAIAELEAALRAPGIHVYSYSGPASSFGAAIRAVTRSGLPGGDPFDACDALVIAADDISTWTPLSASVSVNRESPQLTTEQAAGSSTTYLGALTVGQVSITASAALAVLLQHLSRLQAILGRANGVVAGYQTALATCLDITLLPPVAEIAASLQAAVASAATIQGQLPLLQADGIVSLVADIGGIMAQIGVIASLSAEISGFAAEVNALVSTTGIDLWAYAGAQRSLGQAIADATDTGLPGGGPSDVIHAAVLATDIPSSWAAMSTVLLTG